MDRLLERPSAIQRTLAARHLKDGHPVLYDITSSYFQGAYSQSDIVTFGYNRDGNRGHEQMVITLLCGAISRLCNSKYGPSTTRLTIESKATCCSARLPITYTGISTGVLNLYLPPMAPIKIESGQCAT